MTHSLRVAISDAYEIKGTMYPSGAEKVAPFKILLNGGEQVAYARIDGSFVFRDVAPGRYVVDIPSEVYLFSQVSSPISFSSSPLTAQL